MLAGDRADHADQMLDLGRRAVELADQEALDVERVARVAKVLGGVDRRPVHHLEAARDDAVRDDRGDAVARLLVGREPHQERLRGLGLPQDPHRDLGHDPQQTFRAGHQPEQVVGLGVQVLAADPHHLAVRQHQLQPQHVVGGEAVFQAVHAARVLGDVAADRAGDLARRVGRIVEARLRDRIRDAEVGHARLRDHAAVLEVDLEDPVELAEPQHDPVGERQSAARERGAGAARHDLDPLGIAQAQDLGHLRGGLGQHDRHRHRAVGREAIALIGAQLVLGRDHPLARHDLPQAQHDLRALGERRRVGLRHAHRGGPLAAAGPLPGRRIAPARRPSQGAAGRLAGQIVGSMDSGAAVSGGRSARHRLDDQTEPQAQTGLGGSGCGPQPAAAPTGAAVGIGHRTTLAAGTLRQRRRDPGRQTDRGPRPPPGRAAAAAPAAMISQTKANSARPSIAPARRRQPCRTL